MEVITAEEIAGNCVRRGTRRLEWLVLRRADMLVDHQEVPQLLRRRHIHSGYRPLNQSVKYYVASAFRLHNEVVNFWTHLLPFFFIYGYYLHAELFLEPVTRWPLVMLYTGISMLFIASSFTHLMHSRSQIDHVFWLLVDFSGILTFSLCVGLQRLSMRTDSSPLYVSVYLYMLIGVVYLQYWTTCGFFVIAPFWNSRHVIRLFTCLSVGSALYIPLMDRYFSMSPHVDPGLPCHSSAFMWLLISGVFMGVNFPECMAPGRFDYFFYGHQLFHLCIFMVTWNVCEAARIDAQHVDSRYLINKAELFGPVMKILLGNAVGIVLTVWGLVEYAKEQDRRHVKGTPKAVD